MVIVQSKSLTIKDPEFRTAIEQASKRLDRAKYVVNVESPLAGKGSVSRDGHTALIDFEITVTTSRHGIESTRQKTPSPRFRRSTTSCPSSSSETRAPTKS